MLLCYSVVVDAVVATYVSYCRLLWLMSKYEKFLRMVISRVLQNWWLIIVQICNQKWHILLLGKKPFLSPRNFYISSSSFLSFKPKSEAKDLIKKTKFPPFFLLQKQKVILYVRTKYSTYHRYFIVVRHKTWEVVITTLARIFYAYDLYLNLLRLPWCT